MTLMQTIFLYLQYQRSIHIEVPCILERHFWNVMAGESGFLTLKLFDMTRITYLQTSFLVLKHQRTMNIEVICISEGHCLKKDKVWFELRKAICTLVRVNCANPRKETQHLIFGQIEALTIILHCSSVITDKTTPSQPHRHQHQVCLRTGNVHHHCKTSALSH